MSDKPLYFLSKRFSKKNANWVMNDVLLYDKLSHIRIKYKNTWFIDDFLIEITIKIYDYGLW